jgi:hypothetical protein
MQSADALGQGDRCAGVSAVANGGDGARVDEQAGGEVCGRPAACGQVGQAGGGRGRVGQAETGRPTTAR